MDNTCYRDVIIEESISPEHAIGTFAQLLENESINGCFGDFVYCTGSGRQVALGDSQGISLADGGRCHALQEVFMSRGDGRVHRRARTWEQARAHLLEGFVFGTDKHPGIKVWYVETGRNARRQADDIFVIPF